MNSVAFKAGAIGAAIGAAVTWVIFFAAWGSIGLSPDSIEFNNLLASTISATVVIIATFLVSLTVVGAIVLAVIAVFDLIALIICKAGVKAVCALGFTDAIIRLLSEWIYTGEVMIDTSGDPPITNVADARMQLTNPALGLVAGNSVRFELDLFSRVQHATPKPSVVLNYPEFYTPADLNSTTVRYSLDDQKRDIPTELNQSGWSFIRMYKIAYRQAPAPVVGWLAPSARRVELYSGTRNDTVVSRVYQLPEAKINVTLPLYLNTGMALPRYDCWFSVCKHKSVKSTTNMDFGQNFILDVLPATLDGFVHWSELGPQIDADGDGVPAYLDPDPTTWDADGDGVPDGFELQNVMNPRAADGDNDGLNDADELRNGSDPKAADTDSDGLSDGEEVNGYMLTLAGVAVHVTSDPLLRDTDTDGMSDGIERLLNALNPASYPFNPRVFNESPLRLYQSMSDGDRVLAIGAQMTYTATVFNGTDVEDELLSTGSYNAALPVELGSATATRSFTLLPGFSDEIVLNGTAAAGERYVAISVGAAADIMPFGGRGRAIDATFTDIILNDALPVTIDNDDPDDPELTLGAFVQPNSYVVIGGTASDPTSYIRQVEVSVAGGPFAPASGTSLWAFGLDIPDQADGSVAVQVRATDAVGHTRTKAFDLTIDGTPPDVAIDLAENAIRTVRRNADGDWTLALSGSNSDALAGIRDASFQIGASASLVITDVDGAWTFPYPFDDIATNANPAPTGPYTLTLTVRDNALPDGNAVTRVIPFIIDMTPPVIEQLSHLDEALLLDGAVITGTVRDRYAAVSGVEFAFVNAEAVLEVETTLLHLPFNDLPETVLFDNIAPGPARIFCLDETCPLSGEAGADGRAVRFDGTDDLLRAFEGFDLPESGFSTAFWFNTTCADCGLFSATAAAFPAFGAHDRDIYLADGKICVDVAGAGVETRCTLGDGYADGQWHQVVHTLGASGNALYVDGQPAVSSPTVASSFTAQADLLIGYSPAAGTPFLNGSLDDFVIYEGALSPATVATLYRPWQPADVSGDTWSFSVPDGLEGYYQIDMRAFDSLGNRTELRGDWPQFRGPIDTALPTFDVSAAYRGSGSSAQTLYGVTVRDYNLTTDNYQFVCPLTADQLRYPAGAGELAYSDGTSNRLGEIVARCNRAGFQSSLVAASACDRYGHCAAAVPPQVEAYIGTIDNQILPFGTLPNAIERANLSDPANRVRLLERPGKLITDIAVDTLHGYLYWGERAEGGYAQPGGVWRARLDGSEVQQLVSNLSVYAPEALQIAIDPTGNKLYWTKGHELWWANLDGSLPEVVYAIPRDVPGTEQIGDVAIDPANNALYISERRLRSSQAGYNPSFPNIGVTYKHTLIVRSDLAGGAPEFFAGVGNGCTYENYYDNLGYGIGLGQDPIDCLYAGSDGFDVEALTVSNGTLYWAAVDVDGINSGIYGRTPGEAPFTVAPLAFPGATDRGLRYGPLPQMYVAPTSGGVFVLHDKTIVRGERDGEFTLFTDFVADVAQAGTIVQRSSSTLTAFTAVRAAQTVQTDADLSVEMTSPALVLLDGETAAYNLTLRNEAALPAAGTILTLTLPTGTAFATSDGACNDGGTLVTCDFGYFPALSRQTLAISFTVATDEVRTLTATATIASTTPERTPANNRVTHNTITAAPSLADVDGLPYIYFGDSGKLTRIPLFGDRTPEPVQVEGGVASHILAADPQRGRLYMITADDKLVAINPDGTGRAELANVNPIPLASQDRLYVAVDETSGQLYWSEITSLYLTAIKRANPDGSGVETVVANVRAQKGLLIDPVRGHLYWVALDTQGRRELIYRSNLDGSNPEVVHTAREGSAIRYLALDPYNQKLYWLDPTYGDEGGLIWADSGGGRVTVLLDETSRDARGIIVRPYENAIYYAGYGSIWQNVLAANGSDEDWVADFNGALYAGLSNLNPAVFAPAYLFPPTGNLVYMTANPFGDPPCIVNDTHEPNDTAATAAALDAGSGAVSTTGALCRTQQGQPQDIDHYRIALNNGARMTVTLGSLPADYGLYVMRDGVTVKTSVTAGQADERIVIDNYDAAADYTIVVFSATPVINPNPYTLAVALGAAPPQTVFTAEQCLAVDPADAAGLAGNGTQANATPATLGTPVTGALCHQNDIDVYAFDAVAGATLTFDLPQRPADYALQLYRPDGTFVTALTAATYGSRVQIDVTGRWAVAVGAANLTPTLSTYQLLIGDDSCRVGDAYEPNDLLTAPAVLGAPGRVSATLCDDGDSDHFRISAGAGQRLTVNLPATSVAATLRVLDASGREIGRLGSGQQGQFVLPAAGDYTLVVGKTAPGGDSVPYLFQWLLDAPQPVNDRPYLYYTAGMPGRLFRVALDAGRYTAEPIYLSAAQTYAGPAIAADTLRGYLYSFGLGLGNDQIRRNDLLPFDGSGYTVVIANPNPDGVLTPPVALAADELNGRLYWIQPQGGSLSQGSTIWRADSDGSNAVQVVGNGLARNSLVVDSISGRLYWTEDGAIWRGDLDGNDAAIVRAAVAGQPVRDLALDPFAGRLYWIDATRGLLLRANADGSGASTLIAGLDPSARGVALLPLQNALYYSDGDRLMQAALDGSNPVTLRRLNGVYPGPSNLDPAAYHFETIAVPQSSLVIGRGTPVVSPCTLADAHEPNNSAGGATPLSVVTTTVTTGALCNSVPGGPADIDFYQIVVANQTQLTVTLSGLPADYSLSLSDSGGRLLAASVTPGLVDEQVSFANNSGGDATYFVRVGNSGFGNHSPYTLTATIGAAPPPPPDDAACGAVDRYDAPAPGGNGTLAGATDLTLNQALVAALCYADDVDMYRFAGRAEQTIIVDLPVRPADYELTLYNPDGVPYDYPAYGAAVRLDDDGMWTLAVSHSALTPTTAQYQLLVSDTHCIADDSYEPNNDLFSVRPLARGERVRATLCSAADVDIFSVSASSGEQLTINYPLNASGAVVRVEPAAVVSNLGEVTPGGQLVVILPANTDYHIIVENSATVETNVPYEFEVLVGPRPTASSDTPYIYYGRSGDLVRADDVGGDVMPINYPTAFGDSGGRVLAADAGRNLLYVLDPQDRIVRVDPLGQTPTVIVSDTGAASTRPTESLAVDERSRRIYWVHATGSNTGDIRSANGDGSDVQTVISAIGADHGLAIDPLGGRIYWVESGGNPSAESIRRANLDGSGVETIYAAPAGRQIRALTLDPFAQTLYWRDATQGRLLRLPIGGSAETVVNQPDAQGFVLLPLQDTLYYAAADQLWRAALDGSNAVAVTRLDGAYNGIHSAEPDLFAVTTITPPGSNLVLLNSHALAQPCDAVDGYEPNNTPQTARGIGPTTLTAAICSGDVTQPDSFDYYQIVVSPFEQLDVTLSDLPLDYGLSLSLNGVEVAWSNNVGTADERVTHVNRSAQGATYIIAVQGGGQSSRLPYTLQVATAPAPPLPPPPPPPPDGCLDVDPYDGLGANGNYAPITATPIDLNTTITAALCYAGDRDFYAFDGQLGQNITINMPLRPHDYRVTLYDPSGRYYAAIYPGSWLTYGGNVTLNATGRWVIVVWDPAQPATTVQYELSLTYDSACDGLDPYEPNDQPWEVAYVVSRTLTLRAVLCQSGDRDYFEFPPLTTGERVTITPRQLTDGMQLSVLEPGGGSHSGVPNAAYSFVAVRDGIAGLLVESSSSATNQPYEIDVVITPVPPRPEYPANWSCSIYSSSDVPQAIDDLQTAASTLSVADDRPVTYVAIRDLIFQKQGVYDTTIGLAAPDGTLRDLFDFGNFSWQEYNFCGFNPDFSPGNCHLSIDDWAVEGLAPPVTYPNTGDAYRPTNHSFTDFNGSSAAGRWTLLIDDASVPDPDEGGGDTTGDLVSWSLELCVDNGLPPADAPPADSTPAPQTEPGNGAPDAASGSGAVDLPAIPPACYPAADDYEDDDLYTDAVLLDPATGVSDARLFDGYADRDWLQFDLTAGLAYTLSATAANPQQLVTLALFDGDGTTFLYSARDRLAIEPSVSGRYYVRATNGSGMTADLCRSSYTLALSAYNPNAAPILPPDGGPLPAGHDAPPLAVGMLTPQDGTVVTATGTLTVEIGLTAENGVQRAAFLVNGSVLDTRDFGSGRAAADYDSIWTTDWTPAQAGVYTLTAVITDTPGAGAASEPNLLFVDLAPPNVSVNATDVLLGALLPDGSHRLTGTATDDSRVRRVEVQLNGGDWLPAVLRGGDRWELHIQPQTLPDRDGGLLAIAVRAIDMAGRSASAGASVLVDITPPATFTVTTSLQSGVPITDGVVTTEHAARLSWPDLADATSVHVGWSTSPTPTLGALTARPATAGNLDTLVPEASVRYAHAVALDVNGNARFVTRGPFYFDGPATPDLVADLELATWTASGGKQVAQMGSDVYGTQRLFAGWNANALRLRWSGLDVDSGSDLFLYLGVGNNSGGLADQLAPAGGTPADALPFSAHFAVHVAGSTTATLYRADGGVWTAVGPVTQRSAGAQTDVLLPLADLGITSPAATALRLLGVATGDGTVAVRVTLPDKNLGRPWNQFVTLASLGSGIIPADGVWADAHVAVAVAAEPDPAGLVGAGDAVTLTVAYALTGAAALPALTLDAAATGGVTIANAPQTAANLPAGSSGTLTLRGTVAANGQVALTLADSYHRPYHLTTISYSVDSEPPVSVTVALDNVRPFTNTIRVAASDASPLASAEVEIDGGARAPIMVTCAPDGGGGFVCTWNAGNVSDGTLYTLRARATDRHGNVSGWSAGTIVLGDATPPTLTLSAAALTALGDDTLNANELQLDGLLSDNVAAAALRVCSTPAGGPRSCRVATRSGASSPTFDWSVAVPAGGDGITTTLELVGFDLAGNASVAQTRVVTIDNTPPTVGPTTPAAGMQTSLTPVTIAGGSATDGGGLQSVRLIVQRPDNGVAQVTATLNNARATQTWSAEYTPDIPGNYRILVVASDAAGNRRNASGGVLVVTADPNLVELDSFAAVFDEDDGAVLVSWETATELDNAGFNVYRTAPGAAVETPLNAQLIASQGAQGLGATYSFRDVAAPAGTWLYWLEAIDTHGGRELYGPVNVTVTGPTAVGLLSATVKTSSHLAIVLPALTLVALTGLLPLRRRQRP